MSTVTRLNTESTFDESKINLIGLYRVIALGILVPDYHHRHRRYDQLNLRSIPSLELRGVLISLPVNLTDPVFRGIYRGKKKHEGMFIEFDASQDDNKTESDLKMTLT